MDAASAISTTSITEVSSVTEASPTTGVSSTDQSPPIMEVEKPCLLLELAPELRNTIYRYALVTDPEDPVKLRPRSTLARKALLDTCTQICTEATSIFWAENSFQLCGVRERDIEEANYTLSLAGPEPCRSITRLVVPWRLEELPRVQLFVGFSREWFPEYCGTWARASAVAAMLHRNGVRFDCVVAEEPETDTEFFETHVKSAFEETFHDLNTRCVE